jgi:HPt (histidine-containing phosphotransfer) domain-containing protein
MVAMSDALLDQTILNILEQRLGRDRVAKVVAAQLSHGVELMRELAELEQAPNPARIRAIAHQMAGSSGSIGLTSLGQAAADLEMTAADLPPDGLSDMVARLVSLMRASFARLTEVYPEAAV